MRTIPNLARILAVVLLVALVSACDDGLTADPPENTADGPDETEIEAEPSDAQPASNTTLPTWTQAPLAKRIAT